MKEGPDIAAAAAAIGDPARANMLMALMSGLALTAGELAREAGVTAPTASGHLAKLEAGGLVASTRQGRHRYFRIADADVAHAIEALVTIAARTGRLRTRPGPRDAAMREARTCYDHLAGRHAVALFEHWEAAGIIHRRGDGVELSPAGRRRVADLGIDVDGLARARRPQCRVCIDWSERRNHLGGSIGAAVLDLVLDQGWARREADSRVVRFSPRGLESFAAWYAAGPVAA